MELTNSTHNHKILNKGVSYNESFRHSRNKQR